MGLLLFNSEFRIQNSEFGIGEVVTRMNHKANRRVGAVTHMSRL